MEDKDGHWRRQQCLDRMRKLHKQVQEQMNVRKEANDMNKYKCHYEMSQPSNLIGGELKQHQIESLEWMIGLACQGANGILADDMGLGKTIQSIAYMAYLKEENGIKGKHLIICPKSVLNNWYRQIKKWLPCANVHMVLGNQSEREDVLKRIIKPRKFDIAILTYETFKKCANLFLRINWQVLVVDEAHKIKNSQSQNFICISRIKASFKLLLTGTPLNNNLRQLWALLNFIMPDIFSDSQLFDEVEDCVENCTGNKDQQFDFQVKAAQMFHGIIAPYFKRRSKKDLELGLPQKIQKTLYVPLSKMQLQMYKNFLNYGSVYGEQGTRNVHPMVARQICLHPYLLPGFCPEDDDEEQFDEHYIENCGKLKVLDKLLKKLLSQKHKVLLFSQFTMLLDILEGYCFYRGYTFCRLDGQTSIQEREQHMDDFNNTNKYQIFLLSTRAGGLGINLVGADTVILYDIDWNPQNDVQAMDRAYRIGQKNTVHVYKMITEYTIEERISQFQKYKLIWDELVIQKGTFMSKKRQDPFKNFNVDSLVRLGKGQIFRLEQDEKEKTIEEIIALGDQKNKQRQEQIREKLKKNMQDGNIKKISIFDEYQQEDTVEKTEQEALYLMRRNYDDDLRQKTRFFRSHHLPAFNFYIKSQKIKQLQFEIFMEKKRSQEDQNQKLLDYLEKQLLITKKSEKFGNWSQEEYEAFISAHQLFLKQQYDKIAQFINTKTQKQVEEYSTTFFQKASDNTNLSYDLDRINLGQKILKIKIKKEIEDEGLKKFISRQTEQGKKLLHKQKHQLLKQFEQLWKNQDRISKQKEQEQRRKQIKAQEIRKLKEEKQKRLEQNKKAKQIRDQEKRKKAEAWQEVLKQRQEKKQLKQKQKERKRQKAQALLQKRAEEQRKKLDASKQDWLKNRESIEEIRARLQSKI